LKYSVFFLSVMFISFGNLAQLAVLLKVRPVIYKQLQARFFGSDAYVVASTFSRMPMSLAEAVIFGPILYFMTGLALDVTRVCVFILVLFITSICFSAYMRFLASAAEDLAAVSPPASFSIVWLATFAGFIILPSSMNWLVTYLHLHACILWTDERPPNAKLVKIRFTVSNYSFLVHTWCIRWRSFMAV